MRSYIQVFNEQKILELLKDDPKTFYALNVLKHHILRNRNILVNTVGGTAIAIMSLLK